MIEPSSLHSQVVAHLLDRCYDRPLIPNLFRGEYVEAMVLHLLGVDDWMQTIRGPVTTWCAAATALEAK